jgi:peptidoglycan lytic transglycosylase
MPRVETPPEPARLAAAGPGPVGADAGAATAPENPALVPPTLHRVLDDARLARAKERDAAHDPAAAARAVDEARRAALLPPRDDAAWSYLAGRLSMGAGALEDAAAAFERAASAGAEGGLEGYASLRAAEAYVRLGKADDALAKARAVPDDLGSREEARLALADALSMHGDRAAALEVWRAVLAANPRGLRWADTHLRVAEALLDGIAGPASAHAEEAFDLATHVLVEAPQTAASTGVQALRARAVAAARPGARLSEVLRPVDRARQAQAWLDQGEAKEALTLSGAVLAEARDKPGEVACRAAMTRAEASARIHTGAHRLVPADAWGDAARACADDERLATALYFGGKASASAHRPDEALARFARVEQLFPGHRLADDARFQGAKIVADKGDDARALTMLSSLADDYPDGDLRGEALFRAALAHLSRGELDAAKPLLDRATEAELTERAWSTAGRSAYFRARASELGGDVADATRRYVDLVQTRPLDFYMLEAYARLTAVDPQLARATLEKAQGREPQGPFFTHEHPELATPAFQRAVRLLEVGDLDAAKRELSAAGLLGEATDPEDLWAIAHLYELAGAPELAHAFSRGKLVDFASHYPSGRWRFAWESAFPRAFDGIVGAESEAAHVSPALVWAVMREESAFNPDAHSGANAIGLMQLLPGTARYVARGTSVSADEPALRRPEVSVALGAKYLASLRASFPAAPVLAIAAYNGGSGSVRSWLAARPAIAFDLWVELIPFDETRTYLKRVVASEAAYAFLYAKPTLDELLAMPDHVDAPGSPAVVTR